MSRYLLDSDFAPQISGGVRNAPASMLKTSPSPYKTCQYPLWNGDTRSTPRDQRFFCGEVVRGHTSWCEFHYHEAYYTPEYHRRKREEARYVAAQISETENVGE